MAVKFALIFLNLRDDVQEVLTRIHFRCDLGQVYGYNITERKEMPRIRYLTSEQLVEVSVVICQACNVLIDC